MLAGSSYTSGTLFAFWPRHIPEAHDTFDPTRVGAKTVQLEEKKDSDSIIRLRSVPTH